jgi:hypothetical protein
LNEIRAVGSRVAGGSQPHSYDTFDVGVVAFQEGIQGSWVSGLVLRQEHERILGKGSHSLRVARRDRHGEGVWESAR